MTAVIQTIATPDGPFTILEADDGHVLSSGWSDDRDAIVARLRPAARPDGIRLGEAHAAPAVESFYAGDLSAIDAVPVRQSGSVLQLAGWSALRRIVPGQPLTYTEFADALGSPRAVRAAASICARNAPALFVPCHRVLRTGGALGGFAWGIEVKRSLLAREAAR